MKVIIVALLSLALWGCGSDATGSLGQQTLGNMVIEVQCRPTPVTVGMNEFMVLATDVNGAPAHDLMVDLRMRDGDIWQQAIQDGFSGVYRKALGVKSLQEQLQVRIKRKGTVTVLHYPLIKPK
ncbi:MAG: hypothetical protein P8173_04490 [Gammaproteobacteria bacterium]